MYRIRTRLIAAILLAALLPAVPMSLVVGNLLSRSLNPALHAELTAGLEAGLAESRQGLARRKADFLAAAQIAKSQPPTPNPSNVTPRVVLLDLQGEPVPTSPEANRLPRGSVGESVHVIEGFLAVRLTDRADAPVIVAQRVPQQDAERAQQISDALSLLAAYRFERESILRSYVMPFLLVYAALIVVALFVAAFVSNRLARPLEQVARAATDVAEGDLTVRVADAPRGEVGDLVRSFNDMVLRLQQQRSELARLEKLSAWRDMARVLAHEIKNPLTPILLAVQQTRSSYDGADEAHAEILSDCETIVTEEVEGLRGLVRSFSDFARPPQPEIKPVEVNDLICGLERLYGDRLECHCETIVWPLDTAQIKRVLINLIDNALTACEHAGSEPHVQLTAAAADALRITVQDKGEGIPEENRARIFEPDFTTRSTGMGLGLAITAGIVEAHGGRIEFTTGPEGTEFTVTLPAGKEQA